MIDMNSIDFSQVLLDVEKELGKYDIIFQSRKDENNFVFKDIKRNKQIDVTIKVDGEEICTKIASDFRIEKEVGSQIAKYCFTLNLLHKKTKEEGETSPKKPEETPQLYIKNDKKNKSKDNKGADDKVLQETMAKAMVEHGLECVKEFATYGYEMAGTFNDDNTLPTCFVNPKNGIIIYYWMKDGAYKYTAPVNDISGMILHLVKDYCDVLNNYLNLTKKIEEKNDILGVILKAKKAIGEKCQEYKMNVFYDSHNSMVRINIVVDGSTYEFPFSINEKLAKRAFLDRPYEKARSVALKFRDEINDILAQR